MNAINLLKEQHEKVTKALSKMCKGNGATPSSSELETFANELVAHMVIEEHIFYPRIKELMKDTIDESFEEHAVARFELARLLQATSSTEKKTRSLVLKELLEHHIKEEHEEMFPKVKKEVSEDELTRLGAKMKATFDQAVDKGYSAFFMTRTRRPLVAASSNHGVTHSR